MSKSLFILLTSCSLWLVTKQVYGVVREDDLIVRWTFDEGNGSVSSDTTGGGIDLLLSANAEWGMESLSLIHI